MKRFLECTLTHKEKTLAQSRGSPGLGNVGRHGDDGNHRGAGHGNLVHDVQATVQQHSLPEENP